MGVHPGTCCAIINSSSAITSSKGTTSTSLSVVHYQTIMIMAKITAMKNQKKRKKSFSIGKVYK